MTDTVAVSATPVNAPAPTPARPGRRRNRSRADSNPRAARAGGPRPEDRLSIRLLQAVDVCFARIYHRVNVLSPQRLPKQGPAILICNHTSGLDPMLIQSVCPRLIVWMMAREYYEISALRWVFKTVEAIPVDRGGRDLAATRAALRALEAGRILGVFPEGKIETSRDLLPFQTGVAMMAVKANVPVYPAYLDGTQRRREMLHALLYPNVASIAFGAPLEVGGASTSKDMLQGVTDRFTDAVLRLKDVSERARLGRIVKSI
jgi:1-acyl-sn-glycerol-3-phosphate acyltransferase